MFLTTERRTFFYFFLSMAFAHLAMMSFQFRDEISSFKFNAPSEPMKVKIRYTANTKNDFKKQIVQSENSEIKEKVDKAFQSDKDRKFERETIARNSGIFNRAAKGNSSKDQMAQVEKEKKLADFAKIAGSISPEEISRKPASIEKMGLENGDIDSKGLSATNDYVQEVNLGDFTQLNTVEFRFYGFFHRIRQKLEQHWGNSIQEKSQALFKSGRRMPASQDLITSLQVTLNERGEIIGVRILGASGVKELDDAAVESFNQAGPFPNPPKDLLVNGKAVIEWGFVVKS